jgi:hypothetical protein
VSKSRSTNVLRRRGIKEICLYPCSQARSESLMKTWGKGEPLGGESQGDVYLFVPDLGLPNLQNFEKMNFHLLITQCMVLSFPIECKLLHH